MFLGLILVCNLFIVNSQTKKNSLEAQLLSNGVLTICSTPGASDDKLIEMMVENDQLIVRDRGRQIFSGIEIKCIEKLSIPLPKLSFRKIEVYGGDDNLLIHYSEANVEHYPTNGLWHLMSAPVEGMAAG